MIHSARAATYGFNMKTGVNNQFKMCLSPSLTVMEDTPEFAILHALRSTRTRQPSFGGKDAAASTSPPRSLVGMGLPAEAAALRLPGLRLLERRASAGARSAVLGLCGPGIWNRPGRG